MLYHAILDEQTLVIEYKSFRARSAQKYTFFPYLLKEFRNRWFLIGKNDRDPQIFNLALDRMINIEKSQARYKKDPVFKAGNYYENSIGPSVDTGSPIQAVDFFVNHSFAQYVATKPLHHSQEIIKKDNWGYTFRIHVRINNELKKDLIAMGDKAIILAPESLKRDIKRTQKNAWENYEGEISSKGIINAQNKLLHQGFCLFSSPFSNRQLDVISNLTNKMFARQATQIDILPSIINNQHFRKQIFQQRLCKLLQVLIPDSTLVKAQYQYRLPENTVTGQWLQGGWIEVSHKTTLEHYRNWETLNNGGYRVMPPAKIRKQLYRLNIFINDIGPENGTIEVLAGSHKNELEPLLIDTISNNSFSKVLQPERRNVLLQQSLLLQLNNQPQKTDKKRNVLVLDFFTGILPKELEFKNSLPWATIYSK